MKLKWYIEFPIVILMIVLGIVAMWNFSLPSCNKPKTEDKSKPKLSKNDERWLEGRDIFKSNCIACHNIKGDGVGPQLKGAQTRWHTAGAYQGKTGDEWMCTWIRNWHDAVDAKYKYAVDMANSRPQKMNIFVGMTDDKIEKIFLYVENPEGLKDSLTKAGQVK